MKFFDDPSEIDYRIIETKHYIDSADWEEVEAQVNVFIRVLKNQLQKTDNGVFHSLAQCDGVGDLLDIKRHINVFGAEEFRKCLLAVYSIKETLAWDRSFDNEKQMKQDFHKEVDRLQRHLKGATLIIMATEKWNLETKYEKSRKGLKKGPQSKKSLIAIEACIARILKESNFNVTNAQIIMKLKKYREFNTKYPNIEENLFIYENLILTYDAEGDCFIQTDETGKKTYRPVKTKTIQNTYIKRVRSYFDEYERRHFAKYAEELKQKK